jgi:hypothetical protein
MVVLDSGPKLGDEAIYEAKAAAPRQRGVCTWGSDSLCVPTNPSENASVGASRAVSGNRSGVSLATMYRTQSHTLPPARNGIMSALRSVWRSGDFYNWVDLVEDDNYAGFLTIRWPQISDNWAAKCATRQEVLEILVSNS